MPLDPTLNSNIITAYVPNPISDIGHKLKHLGQTVIGGTIRLFKARPAPRFDGVRPPGDVPASDDLARLDGNGGLPRLAAAKPATMRSQETWRDLPQLPLDQTDNVRRYAYCAGLAAKPGINDPERNTTLSDLHGISPNQQDAFSATVVDIAHNTQNLLPDSVRDSTLVNNAAGSFKKDLAGVTAIPKSGQRKDDVLTHLSDPKTGFSAGITYDPDRRELVIGFSGLGSANKGVTQFFRCAMNWLGLVPKNLSQASKLTRLVKQHVDKLNKSLPADKQIKLTLTGHSMGGGLASYAALRNKVPAVVIDPMRLGWGARARIGQSTLAKADHYLTEVVAQGDWVADNPLSKLYTPLVPAFNVRGPLGHARRFMVPHFQQLNAHNNIDQMLLSMKAQDKLLRRRLPTVLPRLQQTSPRARGDLNAGNVRPATIEAITTDMRNSGLSVSKAQATRVAEAVSKLVSGHHRSRKLADNELAAARVELKDALDDLRSSNHISPSRLQHNLPPLLLGIEQDLVLPQAPTADQTGIAQDQRQAMRQQTRIDRLNGLRQDYQPGGEQFRRIAHRLGLDDNEIDTRQLQQLVGAYMKLEFGANGEKASRDPTRNQDKAQKATLRAIETHLYNQKHNRTRRVINDDKRLSDMIKRVEDWTYKNQPPQNVDIQEEQNGSV